MTISVIMLTYNREHLVGRAVESILEQTFRDFEFIIINNGSTDNSGVISEEYAKNDNRIRVIHRETGNIGSGRNAGLDAATGNYIAFIDDDDFAEPDFIEFLLALAIENNADVSICGAYDKALDENNIYNAEDALIELLWRRKFNVQFPTKLIKRELFKDIRFSETAKYDDIELMPRILANANCIAYHGLAKYTFVRHPGNNSAWTQKHELLDKKTLSEYLRVYRERTEWLCERFPNSTAAWRYFEQSFHISMIEKITRLKINECNEMRDELALGLSLIQKEFFDNKLTRKFEKDWFEKYVGIRKFD